MQKGYDAEFIGEGIKIPLPKFKPALRRSVLRKPDILRDAIYSDHIHFTLVMNKQTRQLVYSALNIDQSLIWGKKYGKGIRKVTVDGTKSWKKDDEIGAKFQLGPEYYVSNPYDRGHMAMRANTMWGKTKAQANAAGKATFIYANASPQHENLNRDEWKELELEIVGGFQHDLNGKLSIFTGPIYGDLDRHINLTDSDSARVPAGYFKVICYRTKHDDRSRRLGVLAFAIFQDKEILKNKRGPSIKTNRRYQLTISELQNLTGIKFGKQLFNRNPLLYRDNEILTDQFKIPRTPEIIPIQGTENLIVEHDDTRCDLKELATRKIIISSAMINPKGNESTREWISLFNRNNRKKKLKNWRLVDGYRRETTFNIDINAGEAARIRGAAKGPVKLSNQGGSLMLFDQHGCVIDHVTWSKHDVKRVPEGTAYMFEYGQ